MAVKGYALKKFFAGEQKDIFDKALHHMKIYDDSKTFIVNSDIEAVVADGKIQITLPDFVGDFYAGDDPEFKVAGKFASSGWQCFQ